MENGFLCGDEGCEGGAFGVLDTLFVYGEVNGREKGFDDVGGVFESKGEVQGFGEGGEVGHV